MGSIGAGARWSWPRRTTPSSTPCGGGWSSWTRARSSGTRPEGSTATVRRYSHFFRETAMALRRNALVTFAAISTVFISLFLLGGALLVERQVRLMTGEWASKVEVSVFLRE